MSFRVRDWVAYNWNPRYRITRPGPRDDALDSVHDALADATAQARADFPDAFVVADRIRTRPGRCNEQGQHSQPFKGTRVGECPRCGDWFLVTRSSDTYCSMVCSSQHRAFLRRRNDRQAS